MSSDKATSERTASSWLTTGRITVLVLAVLALVFIFENTRNVKIRLLIPEVTTPLWMALLATFIVGGLCGMYLRHSRRRR